MNTPNAAIVFTDKVDVRSEPRIESTQVFVLHAGTRVKLLSQDGTWYNIEISSGNKGWIEIAELENANRIKSENVLDRLSELENIVGDLPSPPIGKVILNAGGEAKVFSIGDLGVLASKLPSEADCVEFGLVLEDTFLRDYWSIFVLKPDGEITMCKFLLGNWEIKDSSRREPGHVVVRVD